MIKRIMLGLSGTPYTAVATQRAVELAQRFDAEVTGVTIIDVERLSRVGPVPIGAGAAARDLASQRIAETRDRVEEAIGAFQEVTEEKGVRARVVREFRAPLEAFKAHARYHDVSIVGLRGLLDYGVVPSPDSIDDLFLRGVRPIVAVSDTFREVNRVLIAYNGSMASAKAMRSFCQLGPWPEAKVAVAHFGRADADADRLLAEAADYCAAHGFEADRIASDRDARDGILREADAWGADLIVLGSMGANPVRRILGRSVLEIVRQAERPLFLAH